MRIPLWLLCLFALSAPQCGPQAATAFGRQTLFFGHDDRHPVTSAARWPWQAIGQLETASGSLCTVTLISPSLALSAGHCVLVPPGRPDRIVAVRFLPSKKGWRYATQAVEILVNRRLGQRLKADGDGWIVPPSAAPLDFALIRLQQAPPGITPVPIWSGSRQALRRQLQQSGQRVTQAGYPEDHPDTLYRHENCLITGWPQRDVLAHQCDTLPGDSGSPLLLKDNDQWTLMGIQSSAPDASERDMDDNRAVAVTAIGQQLTEALRAR
ncbi:serine protease [Affinibrenneria salicis]|uniref:Serine protease n=1 Tax=Affinibrenneria salicis TaxID=2590031 RepID=A0A5J5G4L6_9GAMM|nr:serine protease [Affinibrenneria salicis]KAA9001970.1 serine protease [Affinibrenneria salicis]